MKQTILLFISLSSASISLEKRQQGGSISGDLGNTVQGIWNSMGSGLGTLFSNVGTTFMDLGGSSMVNTISAMTGLAVSPTKTNALKPQFNPAAKRMEYTYGPFELLGQKDPRAPAGKKGMATMDPTGINIQKKLNGMCTGCTVLSGKSYLTFENGTIANAATGIYTHHLFTAAVGKKALGAVMCPNGDKALDDAGISVSTFLASGEDKPPFRFTTADGSFPSGYKMSVMNPIVINSELVNYNDHKESVYLTIDLEFLENQPEQYSDTAVTLLSVTNCEKDFEYKPPKGVKQHEKTSDKFIMPVDGTILNAMGHLHDGGSNLEMRLNDKLVCDSKATYGRVSTTGTAPMPMSHSHGGRRKAMRRAEIPETIVAMSPCSDSITVRKGDVITITSKYDLDAHPLRESGGEEMGGMGIFVVTMAHGPMP